MSPDRNQNGSSSLPWLETAGAGPGQAREEFEELPSEPYFFDDLKEFGWFSIAGSTILAGAVYPLVIAAAGIFVNLLTFSLRLDASFFGGVVVVGSVAAFVGMVWSGIVCLFTFPVLHVLLWSMTLRVDLSMLGAFAGGLIGFVSVLPVTLPVAAAIASRQGSETLFALAIGPGLATICGQLGGARGGSMANWRVAARMRSRAELAKYGWVRPRRLGEVQDGWLEEEEDAIDVRRFRFRTVHLLWLGVWVSLLLTLIQLSGIRYSLILPVIFLWLLFQAATLALGRLLLPRSIEVWRTWRSGRST